jgi:hypothetical protein
LDEPETAKKAGKPGKTKNDIVITGPATVLLRAERMKRGNGRTYTISFAIEDESGNAAAGLRPVCVPRKKRAGHAIDGGPAYTVTP